MIRNWSLVPEDDDTRTWMGYFWLGVGLLLGFSILVFGIAYANIDNNHNKIQIEQYKQETAQKCVEQGHIWINGNCIPVTK